MSHTATLTSLERVLESFLDRAIAAKARRLVVVEGLSRLSEIASEDATAPDRVDRIGDWLSDHSAWLTDDRLRPGDWGRLSTTLAEISGQLAGGSSDSPAAAKIRSELQRWDTRARAGAQRLVLKRAPEASPPTGGRTRSLSAFDQLLERLQGLSRELAEPQRHLMSVLDGALVRAVAERDRDALLLAAFIIYYLKVANYKVEPYVQRLKQAEVGFRTEQPDA